MQHLPTPIDGFEKIGIANGTWRYEIDIPAIKRLQLVLQIEKRVKELTRPQRLKLNEKIQIARCGVPGTVECGTKDFKRLNVKSPADRVEFGAVLFEKFDHTCLRDNFTMPQRSCPPFRLPNIAVSSYHVVRSHSKWQSEYASMKTLVIDIGGTNVKVLATDQAERRKIPSGPTMSPQEMTKAVLAATHDWPYDRVSIGYPGPIIRGRITQDPKNLAAGWIGYDFEADFGRPVRLINDAAMQALGSYDGGRMLFLGLGTGLGSAIIVNKTIVPLELAHLPYKKDHTFEDYLGARGLSKHGHKKWEEAVCDVVHRLQAALVAEYVVIGGGNVKKLTAMPANARVGDNKNAFTGGFRLWDDFFHG